MRTVLDPNVIISAALTTRGAPGRLFRYWLEGAYDLVVSPMLLDELRRALTYSKLPDRISTSDAKGIVELLSRGRVVTEDPHQRPEISSPDPDDDYLIALAGRSRSILVSGDKDLLQLAGQLPIYSPAQSLALIEGGLRVLEVDHSHEGPGSPATPMREAPRQHTRFRV